MAWIPSAGDDDQMAVEEQQEQDADQFSIFEALRCAPVKLQNFGFSQADEEESNERGKTPSTNNEAEQNTIKIKVDSKVYASGDTVTGTVNLNIVHPFLAKGVLVCLHGSEKVHYQVALSPQAQAQSGGWLWTSAFSPFWDGIGGTRPGQPSGMNLWATWSGQTAADHQRQNNISLDIDSCISG